MAAYLERVTPGVRRRDAVTLLALMGRATGAQPEMWGPSIIGSAATTAVGCLYLKDFESTSSSSRTS